MKKIFTLLLPFIFILPAHSQPKFKFTGYFIDLPTFQRLNEDIPQLSDVSQNVVSNLTRLRLRPTVYLISGSRLVLEYEITTLLRNSFLGLGEPPEKTNRQVVALRWTPINEEHFILTHFIDRLYWRQSFSLGNFIVGRQRIAWGTGRIWNPTDMFNPINPANFSKIEKDGADAASLKLYLGNFTDVQFVYNAVDDFSSQNYAARFRSNLAGYDFSLVGGNFDNRVVVGGDFAGNLFKAGLRGEGMISAEENHFRSNFVKYILGVDYQFNPKLYGLMEYHFNGEGTTNKAEYDLFRLLNGEILNLNRNYLYLLATYQIHPLLNSSLGYNANLKDGSGFVNAIASYSLTENSYISLGLLIPYGSSFSEYWYYAKAVYLQGEFYF